VRRPTLDGVSAVTAPRTRIGWLPVPTQAGVLPRWARWALVVNLVAEVGIVVTGGLVRLTGSGLGCPTWPECVPGSYTPVVQQPQGIHKYIEFGNRTLTGVVGLAALAALVAVVVVVRRQQRPRRLVALGAAPLIGVVAQAVLGGITVRTHLHPATVAAHFLVSSVVIALSTLLLRRMAEPDGPTVTAVHRELRWLAWGLSAVTALVLLLGTVVTGSGPHSGDAEAPARFGLDPQAMSWLHADAVLVWFGLLAALLLSMRLTGAPASARRAGVVVLVVGLLQGLVGYVQYLTGLPVVAVAVHMLGACLLVVSVTWFVLSLRERTPVPPLTPAPV
jgi:cytochrome c oxidase assembly protein subunit 15